jgi:hypothetical protein
MTATYYRIQSASRDTAILLDPATWQSSAWEPVYRRCADCGGTGTCYPDPDTEMPCATCGQSGEVEDTRHGVSVCDSIDSLIKYFGERECDYSPEYIDRLVLVEVAGDPSADDDHDEEYGATLIMPTVVVSVQPVPAALRAVIEHQ